MSEKEVSKGKTFFSNHNIFRDSSIAKDQQHISTRSLIRKGDIDLLNHERNEKVLLAKIMTSTETNCCDSPRIQENQQQLTPQTCSLDRTRDKEFDFSRFKIVHDKSSLQASKISNFEVSKFSFRSISQPKRRFLKKENTLTSVQVLSSDLRARSVSLREASKKKVLLNMPIDVLRSTKNSSLQSKKVLPQIKSAFGNISSKIRYQTGRDFYPHLLTEKDIQRKTDFQQLSDQKHILVPELTPEETRFSFMNPRLAFNIEKVYREKQIPCMTEAIEQFYAGKRHVNPEKPSKLVVFFK